MNQHEEEYIDLGELLGAIIHRIWIVILAAVVFGAAGLSYSLFAITPMYNASAMMIVNSGDRGYDYVSSDQLKSAATLVNTYSIVITSDTVMNQVRENLGMQESFQTQISKVTVTAVNDTQVMKITVTGTSPSAALQVCEEITKIAPEVLMEVVEAGSVKLVSAASTTGAKVSPNIRNNTILASGAGFLLAVGIITLLYLMDNKIKTENDIKRSDLPLLGVIPTFETEGE